MAGSTLLAACGGPEVEPPGPTPETLPVAPVVTSSQRSREGMVGVEDVILRVTYSRGSPLLIDAQPASGDDAGVASDALPAGLSVWHLTGPPRWPQPPESLATITRQVVHSHAPAEALPALDLSAGARWARLVAPDGAAAVISRCLPDRLPVPEGRFRGVLPQGISAGFLYQVETAQATLQIIGGRLVVRRVAEREFEMAFEVSRHTHRSVAGITGLPERELALLDPLPLAADEALLIAVPVYKPIPGTWGYAIVLEIPGPPAPGSPAAELHAQAFAACVAALGSARPFREVPPPPMHDLPVSNREARTLGRRGQRRPALAALAGGSGARLTTDLVRSAPEALLEQLAGEVLAAGVPLERGPLLGWACEQASLRLLAEQEPLTLAQASVLRRFAGGAWLQLEWLRELADGLHDLNELDAALAERNRLLLRDASPAVRSAAHAWLSCRDLAVEGYHPLGDRVAREQALRGTR